MSLGRDLSRESTVFNIPGVGEPNLQHNGCHVVPEKLRNGAADAADAELLEFDCDSSEAMIWTEMETFTR